MNTDGLRIAMFCPYSLSIPGGVQTQVLGLAHALRRSGHEVRVLGPCDGPPPASFVTPLGDSLPTAANGSVAPLAPDPSAAMRTIRALRDEQFDVWHLHEPLAPGPTLTALTLRSRPIVATFHAAGRSSSYRFLKPVLKPLTKRIDHRVAVSNDAKMLVERHFPGEYEVLFNGVELPDTLDSPSSNEASAIAPSDPSVLFVGRHEERKGLSTLLEAVELLFRERNIRIVCHIIGQGPDTDRLRQRFADVDRYRWHGQVTESEKMQRLRDATAFVAPALRGESFGVVLLEAMAASTPVIASDIAGYRNVATNGVDAVLVQPGDSHDMADAIQRLIADNELRMKLINGGLQRASSMSMERLASLYVDRYRQVLNSQT